MFFFCEILKPPGAKSALVLGQNPESHGRLRRLMMMMGPAPGRHSFAGRAWGMLGADRPQPTFFCGKGLGEPGAVRGQLEALQLPGRLLAERLLWPCESP